MHIYEKRDERNSLITEILKGCKRIGINGHSLNYNVSEYLKKITKAKLIDVSANINSVIAVKDKKEISEIKKACSVSSETASAIPKMLFDGITEKEMARLIESSMRDNGGYGNAFETIAAFGPNSAEPHYRPGEAKLKKGDAALFDFGSKYGMYCSDLTRTVFFGKPKEILERAYDIVLKAKNTGMKKMYDGASAKDADTAARQVIDESEFKGKFIHSFGHGIGMNIHESPSVSHISDDILKEGMVVSAEPGIYIPGIGGIRIEDTVLITKNGCESLTKFDDAYTVI